MEIKPAPPCSGPPYSSNSFPFNNLVSCPAPVGYKIWPTPCQLSVYNQHPRRHFNALEDRREANKLSPTRRERNRESFPRKTIRFCRQNQHPSKRREDKYYTCFWRAFWLNNNEFEQSLELAEGGIHPHLHQDPGHGIGLCPHHHHNCLVVYDHRENYCCLFRLTSSLKRY